MQTVFSHIIQKRFSHVNEDVATDALAYVLESSDAARHGMTKLLRGTVPDLPPLRFKTQKTEGGILPDMWGYADGEPRVFVENKFWAGLTDNQPQLVCIAEVDAVHLARLNRDQPAKISGRALGSLTIPARIERIGNIAARPALHFADPRMPVDRTVGKVVLSIDNQALRPVAVQLDSLVGLQVEVSIPLNEP